MHYNAGTRAGPPACLAVRNLEGICKTRHLDGRTELIDLLQLAAVGAGAHNVSQQLPLLQYHLRGSKFRIAIRKMTLLIWPASPYSVVSASEELRDRRMGLECAAGASSSRGMRGGERTSEASIAKRRRRRHWSVRPYASPLIRQAAGRADGSENEWRGRPGLS